MRRKTAFILFVVTTLYLEGCYYDRFNELHPLDGYVNTCDDTLPDNYQSVTRNIMLSNCTSCHNSNVRQGDVVLETYSQVKQHATSGELMGAVRRQNGYLPMPPDAALRDCDIEQLQQWINNGMPE
jgi:mono/diheme cytochrome c family protein